MKKKKTIKEKPAKGYLEKKTNSKREKQQRGRRGRTRRKKISKGGIRQKGKIVKRNFLFKEKTVMGKTRNGEHQ